MASRLGSNSARIEVSPVRRTILTVAWRAGNGLADAHPTPVGADVLFDALDGLELVPQGPHMRVYSIFDQDDVRWIQYALEEARPTFMGTLRMTVADSADQVVGALRSWLVDRQAGVGAMDRAVAGSSLN